MDDWVALAKTRWQLRRAVMTARQVLNGLKVDIHPDKTFVGRVSKGSTFLGCPCNASKNKTLHRVIEP